MPGSSSRSVAAIDADLRALGATRRAAEAELAEVRRRQGELVHREGDLVVAVDLRARRIDDLLDERLRALGGGRPGAGSDRPDSHTEDAGSRAATAVAPAIAGAPRTTGT
ncbi:hypothetical protein ACI79C_22850 [Geodermatophilus sp. SYSU D00697]